jgi:cytochrome c oxidase cbb3-type subunit 3
MKEVISQSMTDKLYKMINKLKKYHPLFKGKPVKIITFLLCIFANSSLLIAQAADASSTEPLKPAAVYYDRVFAYTLVLVTALLAAVILVLGNVFLLAIKNKITEQKKNGTFNKAALIIFMLATASNISAQSASPAATANNTVVSETVMYIIGAVLVLELLVIFYFALGIRKFLKADSAETVLAAKAEKTPKLSWFDKLHNRNTQEDLVKLDLGHNYDGIKELDNDIPIWWKYAFGFTIVFGIIYLYVYHVAGTRPLQQKELQIEQEIAAVKQAAFLEHSANNVDEKTVTILGADDIVAGKALYIKPGACVTCHAENGSAIVNGAPGIGPNLADEYWLHKGDIKSIFYSIKYGWPEKGMKSWKEDYSPKQIAQLANYVKSLQGTNPSPAKEKQGVLFIDSTSVNKSALADSAILKTK